MSLRWSCLTLACVFLGLGRAAADDPPTAQAPISRPGAAAPNLQPSLSQAVAADVSRREALLKEDAAPAPEGFAHGLTSLTEAPAATTTPGMLGDLPPSNINAFDGPPNGLPNGKPAAPIVVRIPVAAVGAFKIAEDESPRPVDRVFFFYNFYSDVNRSINGPQAPAVDLHREVFGFEKTFLAGNASIGLRAPITQLSGDPAVDSSDFGDLSIIFKYAFINDLPAGNVLSAGLVVTAPTGRGLASVLAPDIHPALLQPYVGYIYNLGPAFLQGFSSIVVPTDMRDAVLLFNDAGIGYRFYRAPDAVITSVVPAFEVHINTPLSHRGSQAEPVGVPDWVDLTAGCHFGLYQRSTLSLGVATPVTGPKPFGVEALAQFNLRF